MQKSKGWIVRVMATVCAMVLSGMVVRSNAQQPSAQDAGPVANPVSTVVKAQLARYGKNMVAAAESMPAEKYGFKPTPEMNTFGHTILHILQSNYTLCSKLSGQAAPELKLADT